MKIEENKNGNHYTSANLEFLGKPIEVRQTTAKTKRGYNPVKVGSFPSTTQNGTFYFGQFMIGQLNIMSKNLEFAQQKELLEQISRKRITSSKMSYKKLAKK
jgi:hypothetical protein